MTTIEKDTANTIKGMIYVVRGVRVMLDADLAAIYGYTTKAFNQQVKNNIEKFDADFRFQLTKEEYSETDSTNSISNSNENKEILKSKILTSSWGGKRKLPYAFTEQGIYPAEVADRQIYHCIFDALQNNPPLILPDTHRKRRTEN